MKIFCEDLTCFFGKHKWEGPYYLSDKWGMIEVEYKCAKCGKIKKEWI